MHRSLAAARLLLCAAIVILLCAAARPFERLEPDSAALPELQLAADAGLLGDYSLPEQALSRLEAAVLVSRALNAYGDALTSGTAADGELESALDSLSNEFADEMAQLGYAPAPGGMSQMSENLRSLNAERSLLIQSEEEEKEEEEGEESRTYADAFSADEDGEGAAAADEPAVEVAMYGLAQLQAQASSTDLRAGGSESTSNVEVYWGELGWEATYEDWRGHFSVLLNDEDGSVDLYEAYLRQENPDSHFFFQLGRAIQPLGNNTYYSPTYPAVNDLGFTSSNSIGVGVNDDQWGLSAWAFNPQVEVDGGDDGLNEYSVVWDVSKQEATECEDGWKLTAGYTSALSAHDLRLAGDGPLDHHVAALNLFGRYDWDPTCCSPRGSWHFIVDYTAAQEEYAAADLDANGDGIGDKPSAINFELVHEPLEDQLWGLTYQGTDQMADYAESRWGLLYGERINKLVMLKLLASRGKYGEYATGDQDTDTAFVAEFGLSF